MKVVGISLYQKLLERAVAALGKREAGEARRATVNLGLTGIIPEDYVTDPAVRLSLYARLLRATSVREIDDLEEEFDDRFGDVPGDVLSLLRLTRLQVAAGRLGIARLDAGPKASALTLTSKTPVKVTKALSKKLAPSGVTTAS
uniref:TRCF domain-containing protein n=1 Tax=Neorhizobium sp. EC2-8 TaxID=3129230 RepID=UPI003101919E